MLQGQILSSELLQVHWSPGAARRLHVCVSQDCEVHREHELGRLCNRCVRMSREAVVGVSSRWSSFERGRAIDVKSV